MGSARTCLSKGMADDDFFFLLLVVSENEGRPTTASEWELHMIFVLWYQMYSTTVTGNKLLCQTYLSCLLPSGWSINARQLGQKLLVHKN